MRILGCLGNEQNEFCNLQERGRVIGEPVVICRFPDDCGQSEILDKESCGIQRNPQKGVGVGGKHRNFRQANGVLRNQKGSDTTFEEPGLVRNPQKCKLTRWDE